MSPNPLLLPGQLAVTLIPICQNLRREMGRYIPVESLVPGGLYILLHLGVSDRPDNFVWEIYFDRSFSQSCRGRRFRVKRLGLGNAYVPEHTDVNGPHSSMTLIGIFRIAQVPAGRAVETKDLIEAGDLDLSMSSTTYQSWALSAVQRLIDAGIVTGANLAEIEEEVLAFGSANKEAAEAGEHTRAVEDAKYLK